MPRREHAGVERIALGASGVETSRIGLGTWAIGGWLWGGTDPRESIATIRAAVERGVTLIDTAPSYGFGDAEEIVGRALAGGLRRKAQIATQAGLAWRNGSLVRDSRPERIRKEVEDSLRRLRTDVIDLYHVNSPDPRVPLTQTARVLQELRAEGKIRAIGVSNFSPAQMAAWRLAAPLDALQSPYNLFEREVESGALPYARSAQLTLLGYSALCRGLLSGRMTARTAFIGDDLRRHDPKFQGGRFQQYLAAVEELKKLARERYGKSVLALSLRWVLDQGQTIALWGARRPEQLLPLEQIAGWRIDEHDARRIDAILARCISHPVSPAFMAPQEARI
jgi:aryl-alcohol dehydrogenase-like predicted oxidoreductase